MKEFKTRWQEFNTNCLPRTIRYDVEYKYSSMERIAGNPLVEDLQLQLTVRATGFITRKREWIYKQIFKQLNEHQKQDQEKMIYKYWTSVM